MVISFHGDDDVSFLAPGIDIAMRIGDMFKRKGPVNDRCKLPGVRQSGKNSADIRMVVDALDLCYTKSHVDTFVIISGDSDFSPLVSKLRENNKIVIGVGVKSSTSDLLIANCDEFIFYDDLVREKSRKQSRKKKPAATAAASKPTPEGDRTAEALDVVMETIEALFAERGRHDVVRECAADSFIATGPAAGATLPSRDSIIAAALR